MTNIEFLYVSSTDEVDTVHIGIFPPYGRYFRREMARRGDNIFWYEADIDEGDVYYHFFLNRDFPSPVFNRMEDLASRRDPLRRSSKHVGTRPFCAVEFQETPVFVMAGDDSRSWLRAVTHHGWIEALFVVIQGMGAIPFRPALQYKNRRYWDAPLPTKVGSGPFALRLSGAGRECYVHRGGRISPELDRADMFRCPTPESELRKRTIRAGAVGYQIFPDRFFRLPGEPDLRLKTWGTPPQNHEFCGGTLRGIINRLDYLNGLGVDFLYLNPVFHAASAHRYDTADYFRVDPLLGTEADLAELVTEAHNRDMAVVLDLALNHCGIGFFAFEDVLEKGQDSRYRDWFHILGFPADVGDTLTYQCWQGDPSLPEFNFQHPGVQEYLTRVACYWLEACDIDGYRLDTCTSLPMPFVAQLSAALRALKPGFTLVGEVWHANVGRLLDEGGIDGVTNYPLYWDVLAPLAEADDPPLGGLADALLNWLFHLPLRCAGASWNFLGNHDLPRILSVLKERRWFDAFLLMIYAVPGCPVLYYGDEAGLEGMDDPDNRGCMDWDAVIDASCVRVLRKLGALRKRLRHVFACPLLAIPLTDRKSGMLGLARECGGDSVIFLLYLGGEERIVDLEPLTGGVISEDILTGETLAGLASLAPYQSRVLYFKRN